MTKQKNETTTEQKTTVADKIPTAGQRAVHFRILAILGIAAACGLSVPPPAPLVLAACTALCTPLHRATLACVFGTRICGHSAHPLAMSRIFSAFHT